MSADDSAVSGDDPTDIDALDAPASAVATKANGKSRSKKGAAETGSGSNGTKVTSKSAGETTDDATDEAAQADPTTSDADPAVIDGPTTVSESVETADAAVRSDAATPRITDEATGLISAADLFADAETEDHEASSAYQFADAGESVEVDESVPLGRPTWQMRRAARRLRARKVRRLVRYVDPWSVLKVSFLFYLCLFVILLLAGVLLWTMAVNAGTVDSVESFIEDLFAFGSYKFDADLIFRASAIAGLVLVFALTAMNLLLAILFNLISDLTGGLRFTVIEEETARPRPRRGRVFADPEDEGY